MLPFNKFAIFLKLSAVKLIMKYWVHHLTFFFQLVFISCMVTLSSCLIWQIISFILPPNEYGCVYAWTMLGNTATLFWKSWECCRMCWLMANISGPVQSRHRLVVAITDSIPLYGSEIGTKALKIVCRMNHTAMPRV